MPLFDAEIAYNVVILNLALVFARAMSVTENSDNESSANARKVADRSIKRPSAFSHLSSSQLIWAFDRSNWSKS